MTNRYDNHEWLSLIDVSGPFLAVPVLEKAFPQGLEKLDSRKKKDLRQAYDEWREALDLDDPQLLEIHQAWIELVLKQGLELDEEGEEDTLKPRDRLPSDLSYRQLEYGVNLRPDYAVVDDQNKDSPLMLISVYGPDVDLDSTLKGDGWASTPAERMVQLCRATEIRLGLLTNGERWMLIDAPVGGVTTFASWYARLWSQEPITLQAFVSLLGIGRFFDAKEKQLPALFDDSLRHQDEVTDALGKQVQRAVEVLIQSLDRADVDRNRELLEGVEPAVLYEAALTVMMRLVFLLSAEERELMDVVKDERFQANYAVSSLRMLLRAESDDIQERRWDAWSRLLAIFRAVYGGIEHETLRMPALGGSLFDPDRFPFLEGRAKGTSWKTDEAKPLPIDNRTVLLLLDAIQLFQGRTLSYRALDVENIGYVYEGLLERTVERAREVTLDLDATKNAKIPWVRLDKLEAAQVDGKDAVEKVLKERMGSSISRIRNDLKKVVDSEETAKLLTACHNDQGLCDRIEPYFHLLRTDSWGYPLVYPKGTFMVTTGTGRRETGTHYTPKSLTEAIVRETLEPVVYLGPAEGTPREEWKLKSPAELLDLKICDPAMGSGAFLVQVCRWLSERLVEAWGIEERDGKFIDVEGTVCKAEEGREPLSLDAEERVVTGRRLIAERCIYGVDINPLAVELAKLSIWLVTLAKGRPFGFLDHNLRHGDSLLGITELDQLHYLDMKPGRGSEKMLFAQKIDQAVKEAIHLRMKLRQRQIIDIHDVEAMALLDRQALEKLELPELVADALLGETLKSRGNKADVTMLSIEAGQAFEREQDSYEVLMQRAQTSMNADLPMGKKNRKALHWCLEFPEVFLGEKQGFDAIIGNPPFLGGTKLESVLGVNVRKYIVNFIANNVVGIRGAADLISYFFLRSSHLVCGSGVFCFLATDSIAQGDSRVVCLDQLIKSGKKIFYAKSSFPWPGKAMVQVSIIGLCHKGSQIKPYLNGQSVINISTSLRSGGIELREYSLAENKNIAFEGAKTSSTGFILKEEEAKKLLILDNINQDVVFPYLSGSDVNRSPSQSASRWVINFRDMPLGGDRGVSKCAKDYPDCLKIVEDRVYPSRIALSDKNSWNRGLKKNWWQFGLWRPALYGATKSLDKFIVSSRVTAHHNFAMVNAHQVPSDRVVVFASDNYGFFALLSSTIHGLWAHRPGSTKQGTTLNYLPTRAFMSFPIPQITQALVELGKKYHDSRSNYLETKAMGLTSFYNIFHDAEHKNNQEITSIRSVHELIDNEILHNCYKWSDIDLDHNYYDTEQGIRFTISERAREIIFSRLAKLNNERHEEEVTIGQNSGKKTANKKSTPRKKQRIAKVYEIPSYTDRELPKAAEQPPPQMDIFADQPKSPAPEKKGNQWGSESIDQILAWLEAYAGWHGKQAILNGCQADPPDWEKSVNELLKDEFIESRTTSGSLLYRAKI